MALKNLLNYWFLTVISGLFACTPTKKQLFENPQIVPSISIYPFDTLYEKSLAQVLNILKPYENNSDANIQRRVYFTYSVTGLRSKVLDERKIVIKRLLHSCGDSLNTSYACSTSLHELQKFRKNEFDSDDLKRIYDLLLKDYTAYYPQPIEYLPYDELVLLVGYLDMVQAIPKLKSLVATGSTYQRKWEAHLALARLGEKESIDYCLAEVTHKFKIKSNLYTTNICYIKQPEVIDLLNLEFFDNEFVHPIRKEEFYDSGSPAQNMINVYAKNIKNFPFKAFEGRGETQADIDLARKWLIENKGKYVMNREEFR